MVRQPTVAGLFYPGQPSALRTEVIACCGSEDASLRRPAYGVVLPHAGYRYSGAIAGVTLAQVQVPRRVILLGPNHHGIGAPAALYPEGAWRTPLGDVPVDAELAQALLQQTPVLAVDSQAHQHEHSLEVLLPFLQQAQPELRIAPICLGRVESSALLALGEALQAVVQATGEETLLVASSDMSHYIPASLASQRDRLAIERILAIDPEGLLATVASHDISMCGVFPVAVLLAAARRRGGRSAELVRYGHSGEVTGDTAQVVGYAGLVIR